MLLKCLPIIIYPTAVIIYRRHQSMRLGSDYQPATTKTTTDLSTSVIDNVFLMFYTHAIR